jgi:type IV pilus assembly protein PilA
MLSHAMRRRLESEKGFTLIELLIVMIILAILMAIAIPVFLGQKDKAYATGAKANARLAQETIEACVTTRTDDNYANCATNAKVAADEPSLTQAINGGGGVPSSLSMSGGGVGIYTVTSTALKGPTPVGVFTITKTLTSVQKNCSNAAGHNVCDTSLPAGQQW